MKSTLYHTELISTDEDAHQVSTIPNPVTCSQDYTSGIIWPETPSDTNFTYICPNNRNFSITRVCSSEATWQDFDQQGCGILAQQLENVTRASTNV